MLKPNPNVIVFGDETFGRWLGHESSWMGLMNGKRASSPLPPWGDTEGRWLSVNLRLVLITHSICQGFDLGLPSLWNCEKHISVTYKPPSLWYFYDSSPNRWRHSCASQMWIWQPYSYFRWWLAIAEVVLGIDDTDLIARIQISVLGQIGVMDKIIKPASGICYKPTVGLWESHLSGSQHIHLKNEAFELIL